MLTLGFASSLKGVVDLTISSRYNFETSVDDSIQAQVAQLLDDWNFQPEVQLFNIKPLEGGANNVNLILSTESEHWVLKLRAPDCELFGTDPVSSIQAQMDASHLGIAPRLLATHETEHHFISEFLHGETLRPDTARANNLHSEVVAALKILHGGKSRCRNFSLFNDIRLFMKGVNDSGQRHPAGLDEMLAAAFSIEESLTSAPVPLGFCHNDLVPQNFIKTDSGLCLVDFDYAGITWFAVDLACATSQFEMTEEEIEACLKLYDRDLDDGQRSRLLALKFCNNLREASWAIMAEPLMSGETTTFDDWSYEYHRDFNLEQALSAYSDQYFKEVCSQASVVRQNALF